MIDLKAFEYREFIKFHTRVRKEFVLRNKEKYTDECFKVGDVVKFKRATKESSKGSYWSSRSNRHDPDGEVVYGIIVSADVQRSGRIQKYNIQYAEPYATALGAELSKTARGIHQVEAVTEEEARSVRLLHDVRRT